MSHKPATLTSMSVELAAEIEQLAGTTALLIEPYSAADAVVTTALTESFATHARVLSDFLYEKPEGKAVGARSYVKTWTAERPSGVHGKQLRKSERLTGLTTRRLKTPAADGDWPYAPLYAALREDLLRFTAEVPADLVTPDFAARVGAALGAAPAVAAEPEPAPEPEPVIAPPAAHSAPTAALEADREPEPPAQTTTEETSDGPALHRDAFGAIHTEPPPIVEGPFPVSVGPPDTSESPTE